MKTKFFLILIITVFMYACNPEGNGKKQNIPKVKYCMELTLVSGITTKDTIELYEGTQLKIDQYKGAYGLNIINYYPLYWSGTCSYEDSFIKWGVIDFKITNIIK
ncbi:MAG: hypothetical protein WC428_02450 [Candidatus Paceibacterota bacterium]